MTRGRVPHDMRAGFALLAAILLIVSAGCAASPGTSPTTSPLPTASPTGSATPPAPSTRGVPSDFAPRSATFISADEGWVLGSTACGAELCPIIVHTNDGGATWAVVTAPPTTIFTASQLFGLLPKPTGIAEIRFADAHNGWVFGPELWATHDAGLTWTYEALPEPIEVDAVVALEVGAGTVHALGPAEETDGAPAFRIASSPVDEDAWQVAPVGVALGAGPVPEAQLVLAGASGWVLAVNRVVVDGARLVNGSWQSWLPPCADSRGPAVLAAWSETGLLAVCDVGLWAAPAGEHLFVSTDGGDTFAERTAALPFGGAGLAAAAMESAFFVKAGATLAASFDAGETWTTVLETDTTARTGYLRFTNGAEGVFIDDVGLLMTRDGGHSWREVSF